MPFYRQKVAVTVLIGALIALAACDSDRTVRSQQLPPGTLPPPLRPADSQDRVGLRELPSPVRIRSTDSFHFQTTQMRFNLEVSSSCLGGQGRMVEQKWNGTLVQNEELPVLGLLPREVLFHRGRSSQDVLCHFKFVATSARGNRHSFEATNRRVRFSEMENTLTIVDDDSSPFRGDQGTAEIDSYELRCENFEYVVRHPHRQNIAKTTLVAAIREVSGLRDAIQTNARQNCRIFQLRNGYTTALSSPFELQLYVPHLEIQLIRASHIESLVDQRPNELKFSLADYLMENKSGRSVFLRLPHHPHQGLRVIASHFDAISRGFSNMSGFETGYTSLETTGVSLTTLNGQKYIEVPAGESRMISIAVGFRFASSGSRYPKNSFDITVLGGNVLPFELVASIPTTSETIVPVEYSWSIEIPRRVFFYPDQGQVDIPGPFPDPRPNVPFRVENLY